MTAINALAGLAKTDGAKVFECIRIHRPKGNKLDEDGDFDPIIAYAYKKYLDDVSKRGPRWIVEKSCVTAQITFDEDKNNQPSNFGSAGKDKNVLDICEMFAGMGYDQGTRWKKNTCDCSSYAVRVYSALSKNIAFNGEDTTAADIAYNLDLNGQRINEEDLQPGDLIFFAQKNKEGKWNGRFDNISHVAIYAGNGMMWESVNKTYNVHKVSILTQPGLVICCRVF